MLRALVFALSLAAPVAAFGAARVPQSRAQGARPAPVELVALNTHETFLLRPDAKGRFGKRELAGWSRFLRCHHTGRVHAMAPRLAELLYRTGRHFAGRKLLVVAGYRAPTVARQKGNPRSPHKRGVACDFQVEGVSREELRDWVRGAFQRVGVGYYPNSSFVHLDVGRQRSAYWIDYSGPGERARYIPPAPAALPGVPAELVEPATDEGSEETAGLPARVGEPPADGRSVIRDIGRELGGAAPALAPRPGGSPPESRPVNGSTIQEY